MTSAQKELQSFALTAPSAQSLMDRIAKRLHEKMTRYNWAGFYLVDPEDSNYLMWDLSLEALPPTLAFPSTPDSAVPTTGKVVVVQDVSKDPRYLAGSSLVKSEIVVPIYANNKLAAELDVERYFADTFTHDEPQFVEASANVVANFFAKT
jgi:L-methionine (R)-S-oxide reductase